MGERMNKGCTAPPLQCRFVRILLASFRLYPPFIRSDYYLIRRHILVLSLLLASAHAAGAL